MSAAAPVSCVISSFNQRERLLLNLRSIAEQSRRPAEVVVVDNASSDGSAAAVRAEFPDVRLVEMPHPRFGACTTFNVGFRLATQEFVAILDDDVVLPPS